MRGMVATQLDDQSDEMLASCDVVAIGENSIDLVYQLAGELTPGGKRRIARHRVSPGGQAATTACTCAALGLRCRYIGAFGTDDHGRMIREALDARQVDTAGSFTREAPNRYAVILIDGGTGERSVLWQRDAALSLEPGDITAQHIRGGRLLHVDTVDEEAAIAAARLARAAGMDVTTDIDTVTPRTPTLVEAATFPVFAEPVPAALTGEPDPARALRALRQRHGGLLCVTLGARGAMLLDGDRLHHAPAFDVHAVDTTGAGDVFRGALIYARLRGDDPATMLRFANAAAAISCTREGAIGGVPTRAEIETLLATKSTKTG